MEIRGGCRGTRTIWGMMGYNISHIFLGLLKTEMFNVSLSFEIWVEIKSREEVGLVLLKVTGEDLEWNVNRNQKELF